MSLEILGKVKEFLTKIVKDEDFRSQLTNKTIDEVKKVMADGGYNFSKEEFETAALQILELKEQGEFHELTEEELVGAVGGWTRLDWYWWKPKPYPKPFPEPQPMYGIVVEPIDPIVQPMYGVITDDNWELM